MLNLFIVLAGLVILIASAIFGVFLPLSRGVGDGARRAAHRSRRRGPPRSTASSAARSAGSS